MPRRPTRNDPSGRLPPKHSHAVLPALLALEEALVSGGQQIALGLGVVGVRGQAERRGDAQIDAFVLEKRLSDEPLLMSPQRFISVSAPSSNV